MRVLIDKDGFLVIIGKYHYDLESYALHKWCEDNAEDIQTTKIPIIIKIEPNNDNILERFCQEVK